MYELWFYSKWFVELGLIQICESCVDLSSALSSSCLPFWLLCWFGTEWNVGVILLLWMKLWIIFCLFCYVFLLLVVWVALVQQIHFLYICNFIAKLSTVSGIF